MKAFDIVIGAILVIGLVGLQLWQISQHEPQPQVQATTPAPKPSKYDVGPPTAKEMLELVNKERKKVGVKPLKIDPDVQKSAQLKADDFVKRDYYAHNVKGTNYTLTPEMAMYVNRKCLASSENINADRTTSNEMVDSWMNSKPHKRAILNDDYSLTGFGTSQEKDGEYYAVQHFCIAK